MTIPNRRAERPGGELRCRKLDRETEAFHVRVRQPAQEPGFHAVADRHVVPEVLRFGSPPAGCESRRLDSRLARPSHDVSVVSCVIFVI